MARHNVGKSRENLDKPWFFQPSKRKHAQRTKALPSHHFSMLIAVCKEFAWVLIDFFGLKNRGNGLDSFVVGGWVFEVGIDSF